MCLSTTSYKTNVLSLRLFDNDIVPEFVVVGSLSVGEVVFAAVGVEVVVGDVIAGSVTEVDVIFGSVAEVDIVIGHVVVTCEFFEEFNFD